MNKIEADIRSRRRYLLLLLLAAALIPVSITTARTGDRSQPVDVQADRSEFDEQRGVQTLIGNVEISQGTMRITASRIDVYLENNQLSRIQGEGTPIVFQQENDAGETVRGEAEAIDFDATSGTLVLSGGATLSQPRQELSSDRIVFDSANQKVSAEGGSAGRVNIRIEPPADAVESLKEDLKP